MLDLRKDSRKRNIGAAIENQAYRPIIVVVLNNEDDGVTEIRIRQFLACHENVADRHLLVGPILPE